MSGLLFYKLRPLALLKRHALRLRLGFSKYVANNALLLEATLHPLLFGYELLTVQTCVRVASSPVVHQAGSRYLSLSSGIE